MQGLPTVPSSRPPFTLTVMSLGSPPQFYFSYPLRNTVTCGISQHSNLLACSWDSVCYERYQGAKTSSLCRGITAEALPASPPTLGFGAGYAQAGGMELPPKAAAPRC